MHPLLILLLQGRTLPDTAIMRMVPPDATTFEQVMAIAQAGAVFLVYALLIAAILAAVGMRRTFEHARKSLDEVGRHLRELVDNAGKISRDVTAVADGVRDSAASITETVEYANQRAKHAVTVLADRVDKFNNLIGVVQDDTQNVIVSAVAALRGVRAGVGAMKKRGRERERESDVSAPERDAPPDLPARPRLRRRDRREG